MRKLVGLTVVVVALAFVPLVHGQQGSNLGIGNSTRNIHFVAPDLGRMNAPNTSTTQTGNPFGSFSPLNFFRKANISLQWPPRFVQSKYPDDVYTSTKSPFPTALVPFKTTPPFASSSILPSMKVQTTFTK